MRAAIAACPSASEAAVAQQHIVEGEAELHRLPPAALEAAQQLALRRNRRLLMPWRQSTHLPNDRLASEQHPGRLAGSLGEAQLQAAEPRRPGFDESHADGGTRDPLQLVLAAESRHFNPQLRAGPSKDEYSPGTASVIDNASSPSEQRLPCRWPTPEMEPPAVVRSGWHAAPWHDSAASAPGDWPGAAWKEPPRSPSQHSGAAEACDESSQWSDTASETSSSSVWSESSAEEKRHTVQPLVVRSSWASAPQAPINVSQRQMAPSAASLSQTWSGSLREERQFVDADALPSMVRNDHAPGSRDDLESMAASQRPVLLPPASLPLMLASLPYEQRPAAAINQQVPPVGSAEQSRSIEDAPAEAVFLSRTSLPLTRASLLLVRHPDDESPEKGALLRASPGSLRVEALSERGLSSEDKDDRRPRLVPLGLLAATMSPVLGTLPPPPAVAVPAEYNAPPLAIPVLLAEGARSGSYHWEGAADHASAFAPAKTSGTDRRIAADPAMLPMRASLRGILPSQARENLLLACVLCRQACSSSAQS